MTDVSAWLRGLGLGRYEAAFRDNAVDDADVLRALSEADLEKHLQSGQGAEMKDDVREKAREEARKKFEADQAKAQTPKPPPEFGSAEDFQLAQALNRLKGKTVLASKTAVERKAEVETTN